MYLGLSSGITVHLHYCMGKLSEWSLLESKDESCGKCGMEKKSTEARGCCDDDAKYVKLQQDHKQASELLFSTPLPPAVTIEFPEIPSPSWVTAATLIPYSNAPPRSPKQARFIVIGSIRV